MRNSKVFCLRLCFQLFLSAQFSNAAKIRLPDPDNAFRFTAAIESLFVKEPNQEDFTQYLLAEKMFLGLHKDWHTFSFYESGVPQTFYTFNRRHVDFEIFHSKSMNFKVKEMNDDIWHFRVVFSADEKTLDNVYWFLSIYTGCGPSTLQMDIKKVERYVRMNQTQDPVIQKVKDLEPAMLYDQKLGKSNRFIKKIFKITPPTSGQTERHLARLVFRTGTFTAERVNDKVVIELATVSDCLYIFYLKDASQAATFLNLINGSSENVVPDITPDLRSYLERGLLRINRQNESEPPPSSQPDDENEPRTLQLANWSKEYFSSDEESP